MSLNGALALTSILLWSIAYAGYFRHDVRAWWWRRAHRRELRDIMRARAHAAFLRRGTTARHRRWAPPIPPMRARPEDRDLAAALGEARAAAAARPSAEIIQFPAGRRARPAPSPQLNGE